MVDEPAKLSGDQLAAVSREISRLKRELYGQGPDGAKTYQCDNMLFAVLQGGLTQVERTLLEAKDEPLVRQVRLRFQEQRSDAFIEAVERIAGQPVTNYASQILFNPTTVVEIFALGSSSGHASSDEPS